MKRYRRVALVVFIIALLIILAVGCYRAAMHEDKRPDTASAKPANVAEELSPQSLCSFAHVAAARLDISSLGDPWP
jgi:hypothetical protein